MASFLVATLSRPIPPFFRGCCSCLRLRLGGARPPSQMKSHISLVRVFSIWGGMPCALVRNWVIPPIVIWSISRLASRVGWDALHWLRLILILSMMGDHGCEAFTLLPIQAPRHLVVWPSSAILIPSVRGASCGCIFQVCSMLCRCSGVPSGIISVLLRLNFAPEARHQVVRMCCRVSYWSVSDK